MGTKSVCHNPLGKLNGLRATSTAVTLPRFRPSRPGSLSLPRSTSPLSSSSNIKAVDSRDMFSESFTPDHHGLSSIDTEETALNELRFSPNTAASVLSTLHLAGLGTDSNQDNEDSEQRNETTPLQQIEEIISVNSSPSTPPSKKYLPSKKSSKKYKDASTQHASVEVPRTRSYKKSRCDKSTHTQRKEYESKKRRAHHHKRKHHKESSRRKDTSRSHRNKRKRSYKHHKHVRHRSPSSDTSSSDN